MGSSKPVSTLPAAYAYVEFDANGAPHIAGTTMKVVELVMAQKSHGWSPDEVHFQHPYLTLSQIHSALAYYWDHKDELDADIEQRSRLVEQARSETGQSAIADRLRGRQREN